MDRIKKYEPLFGSWKVKKKIGEGSFGAVYEVEKSILGTTSYSAVKLISFSNTEMLRGIKLDDTLSEEQLDTIKIETAKKSVREASLMNKLQGRANIVTIYDFDIYPGENTTDVLIRMELLTNLKDYMSETKGSKDLVVKLGIDICRALEGCEEEKIVHRDIKPENIFVNKDGDFKLGDFGLSRKMNKSASMSLRKSKGTPLYMPPEAFGWGQQVDLTSDIYSLGIVLYEMLNDGKVPFVTEKGDFDDEDNAIGRRLEGEKMNPPVYEAGDLWKIIQKACQFEKEERYKSATMMRNDLEQLRNMGTTSVVSAVNELEAQIDSDKTLVQEKKETNQENKIKPASIYHVGDVVTFGSYPQDLCLSDVRTPIEWQVLKVEAEKMLLISKDLLDCKKFHRNRVAVTWETSDIRSWLNGMFYERAFNDKERSMIQITSVEAEKNPQYNTDPGKNTKDFIFLLSANEAENMFFSKKNRVCHATDYAVEQGVYGKRNTKEASWWLRSPGKNPYHSALISHDGCVSYDGTMVHCDFIGVRPVMWINT